MIGILGLFVTLTHDTTLQSSINQMDRISEKLLTLTAERMDSVPPLVMAPHTAGSPEAPPAQQKSLH